MNKTLAKAGGLMIGLSVIKTVRASPCDPDSDDDNDRCYYKHGNHDSPLHDDLDDFYLVNSGSD